MLMSYRIKECTLQVRLKSGTLYAQHVAQGIDNIPSDWTDDSAHANFQASCLDAFLSISQYAAPN